jgi:20S proteasome alpha/beta subunit
MSAVFLKNIMIIALLVYFASTQSKKSRKENAFIHNKTFDKIINNHEEIVVAFTGNVSDNMPISCYQDHSQKVILVNYRWFSNTDQKISQEAIKSISYNCKN